MIAVFETASSGQDAYNFYKNSSALGVSDARSAGVGGVFVGRMHVSGSHTGSVTVTEYGGQTYIVVYLDTSKTKDTPPSGSR